jgi:hypothetical protein
MARVLSYPEGGFRESFSSVKIARTLFLREWSPATSRIRRRRISLQLTPRTLRMEARVSSSTRIVMTGITAYTE